MNKSTTKNSQAAESGSNKVDKRQKALVAAGQDVNRLIQANPLIGACYSMSLIQMRLFVYTLSRLSLVSGEIAPIEIDFKDFCACCGFKMNYSKFLQEADALKSVDVHISHGEITNDNTGIRTGMFRRTAHAEGVGKIWLTVDEFILPYLIDLRRNFTVLDSREYIRLNSFYAMRFYQFCRRCESYTSSLPGESPRMFRISVEQLRKQLGMSDKLPNYAHFKEYVIEAARKELDISSDLAFTYSEIRGIKNKVEELHFTVCRLRQPDPLLESTTQGSKAGIIRSVESVKIDAGQHPHADQEITNFQDFSAVDAITDVMRVFDPILYRKLNRSGIGPDTIQLWVMRYGEPAIEDAFEKVTAHLKFKKLLSQVKMYELMTRQLRGEDIGKPVPVFSVRNRLDPLVRKESLQGSQLDLSFDPDEYGKKLVDWVYHHLTRRPDYARLYVDLLHKAVCRKGVSVMKEMPWKNLVEHLPLDTIIDEYMLEQLAGSRFMIMLDTSGIFMGGFCDFLREYVEREGIMDYPARTRSAG